MSNPPLWFPVLVAVAVQVPLQTECLRVPDALGEHYVVLRGAGTAWDFALARRAEGATAVEPAPRDPFLSWRSQGPEESDTACSVRAGDVVLARGTLPHGGVVHVASDGSGFVVLGEGNSLLVLDGRGYLGHRLTTADLELSVQLFTRPSSCLIGLGGAFAASFLDDERGELWLWTESRPGIPAVLRAIDLETACVRVPELGEVVEAVMGDPVGRRVVALGAGAALDEPRFRASLLQSTHDPLSSQAMQARAAAALVLLGDPGGPAFFLGLDGARDEGVLRDGLSSIEHALEHGFPSCDPAIHRLSQQRIEELGPAILPTLERAVREDWVEAVRAISLLGEAGSEEHVPLLLEVVRHGHWFASFGALDVAARLDPELAPKLLPLLGEDPTCDEIIAMHLQHERCAGAEVALERALARDPATGARDALVAALAFQRGD